MLSKAKFISWDSPFKVHYSQYDWLIQCDFDLESNQSRKESLAKYLSNKAENFQDVF